MLHYSTIEPGTLVVLKDLMAMPELDTFSLVGGTALSLYYGHRISVDLVLFSIVDFDLDYTASVLSKRFPYFEYSIVPNVGIFGFIEGLKVDLVKHHHFQLIAPISTIDGIRFYDPKDIVAMKIAAILKRAVKKDFWDLAELLHHYNLADIIDFYYQKYPSQQLLISIPQAITYFDDAESSPQPVSLKAQTWEGVKMTIRNKVQAFLK